MISLFLFSLLELLMSLGILKQPHSRSTEEVEFKDSGNEVVSQTTAIIHTSRQGFEEWNNRNRNRNQLEVHGEYEVKAICANKTMQQDK